MTFALLIALVPIALLIALGAWLKHSGFLADGFWPQAERLGYYVLLPSLFLYGMATARLEGVPVQGMILALVGSTVLVAGLLVCARPWVGGGGSAFTSVFQGGVRFNNYVGVSAMVGLFGAQGVALAAVANAAIVPTVNILCVLVFARYGSSGKMPPAKVARQVALNPLVLACFAGMSLHGLGIALPAMVEPALRALGQASLPLGLLCVGAALELDAARQWLRPLAFSSLTKFVLMPLAALLACHLCGLTGAAAVAVLVFQALPTASSSYIMARQLGGDAPLMAGIIACQTLLAALALPLAVASLLPLI